MSALRDRTSPPHACAAHVDENAKDNRRGDVRATNDVAARRVRVLFAVGAPAGRAWLRHYARRDLDRRTSLDIGRSTLSEIASKDRQMHKATIAASLLLLLASGQVRADPSPRFKYHGWVEQDRWGATWLSNGVSSIRFVEELRRTVLPFVGKAVEIVTESPMLPGVIDPKIGDVGTISEMPPHAGATVHLEMFVGEARLHRDAAQGLQLRFNYKGTEAIEFRMRDFRLLVRRLGELIPLDTVVDVRDRDDAIWRADGSSMDMLDDGKGKHESEWTMRATGEAICTAKGEFSLATELVLTRLPIGEYEIWATFGNEKLSERPGVRVKRVAFDVVK